MTSKLIELLVVVVAAIAAIVRLPVVRRLEESLAAWAALRKYADDGERQEVRREEWPGLVRGRAGFSAFATALSLFLPVLIELAVNRARRVFRRGIRFPRQAPGYLPRIWRNLFPQRGHLGLTGIAVKRAEPSTPRGRDRAIRLLLAGTSISMLGSRIARIAYPMLVLYLTGSPLAAGWAVFAAVMPTVLVYLPAVVLVDRWDSRRTMLLSELGRGGAIATVIVEMMLGRFSICLLITTVIIEQTLAIFATLAGQRYLHALLEPSRVSSATARIDAMTHIAGIAGLPLAGFLFGVALLPVTRFERAWSGERHLR